MAYTFQTFVFKAVLTSAQMNQVEANVRDHVHGTAGVVAVPDTGLSANVTLNNRATNFTVSQVINANINVGFTLNSDSVNSLSRNWFIGSNRLNFGDFAFQQSNLIGGDPLVAGTSRLYIDSTGQVGVGIDVALTAKLHVAGTGLFTGNLTINKVSARIVIDDVSGIPGLQFNQAGVARCLLGSNGADDFTVFNGAGTTKVRFDLTTGTMITGFIPDARLTTNVALKATNNNFSVSQSFVAAGIQIIANATTGNPEFIFQRASTNAARITSLGTSLISFKDSSAVERIKLNLATTPELEIVAGGIRLSNATGAYGLAFGSSLAQTNILFSSFSAAGFVMATGLKGALAADTYESSVATSSSRALMRMDSVGGGAGSVRFFTDTATTAALGAAIVPTLRMTMDAVGLLTLEQQIKIKGGVPGMDKVLASDATGLATWKNGFIAGGNIAGANRTLGNTDNFSLGFEVNNFTRLNIPVTDSINFSDIAGIQKVNWDLSGTNGKLTQGDVPHGRILTHDFAILTDTASNLTVTTSNTLNVGDIVHVIATMKMPVGFVSPFDVIIDETGTALGLFEPEGRVKRTPNSITEDVVVNLSAIFRCTSLGTGVFRVTATSSTGGTFDKEIAVIHYGA